MTGPKLNERNFVAGERLGTKASARYVRVSAYKAREVLNLIRDLPVTRADEVLQFTDRDVSNDIRKVLASAVANAVNNDQQDANELFVLACYSDEGPTLKRFAARARGRGTKILKRTCHITIVVARMDDMKLDVFQTREAKRTAAGRRRGVATTGATSRKARVERSRERAAGLKGGDSSTLESDQTDAVESDDIQSLVSLPAGAVASTDDGQAPEGHEIKGNADSGLYHVPGSRYYKQTVAEFWFATSEDAEAAGFTAPGAKTNDDSDDSADAPADADVSAVAEQEEN